ncbi:hypothetical protein LINPERPRIM_LOCUS42942, partial [Linum perenne]
MPGVVTKPNVTMPDAVTSPDADLVADQNADQVTDLDANLVAGQNADQMKLLMVSGENMTWNIKCSLHSTDDSFRTRRNCVEFSKNLYAKISLFVQCD